MHTLTLAVKILSSRRLKQVGDILESEFTGLKVESHIVGKTSRGFVQVSISGEDENAALNYIRKKIGLLSTDFESINRFSVLKGFITGLSQSRRVLFLDVGIQSPDVINVQIPLPHLQAQLVDGRKVALEKIAELFGWGENSSLDVTVSDVNLHEKRILAEISENQAKMYSDWTRSFLDRLVVCGVSSNEISWALESSGFYRDVVNVDDLSLFEHAVVCKLGTDAAGLVPRIGRKLGDASLHVFSPRKIRAFLGGIGL